MNQKSLNGKIMTVIPRNIIVVKGVNGEDECAF